MKNDNLIVYYLNMWEQKMKINGQQYIYIIEVLQPNNAMKRNSIFGLGEKVDVSMVKGPKAQDVE